MGHSNLDSLYLSSTANIERFVPGSMSEKAIEYQHLHAQGKALQSSRQDVYVNRQLKLADCECQACDDKKKQQLEAKLVSRVGTGRSRENLLIALIFIATISWFLYSQWSTVFSIFLSKTLKIDDKRLVANLAIAVILTAIVVWVIVALDIDDLFS